MKYNVCKDPIHFILRVQVIAGNYGFIAQLNEGRHLKKRPTEFRVDKVLQPFDGSKFNFTKVGQEEVLFQFEASEEDEIHFFPNASIDVANSPSVVAINVCCSVYLTIQGLASLGFLVYSFP